MGHRRNNNRNLALSQNRKGSNMGTRASPSGMPPRPLRHSSPVRQLNRSTRRSLWGSGGTYGSCNTNEKQSQYTSSENFMWSGNFTNNNRSPNSYSIGSDGCHSVASDGASINSTNSDNIKSSTNNSSSNKKVSSRPSNPLRYKTELCRSFEESGDCRFGAACTFAHGLRELRPVVRHPRYKTDLCRTYHGSGYCQYGARCHFVHDPEESTGIAALRGYKLRSFGDGINKVSLPTSENNDERTCSNANALILENLQRLHAYRTAEPEMKLLDSSGCDTDFLNAIGLIHPDLLPLNLLTIDADNMSSLTPASQSQSQGNYFATKTPLEYMPVNYMDFRSLDGEGSKVCLSASLVENDLRNAQVEVTTTYSFPLLDNVHCSSKTDLWKMDEVSTLSKNVWNPMEVSRSLKIPTITELVETP